MSDPEKQTPQLPKIDFNEPGLLEESVMPYDKQRQVIEAAIGDALTNTFEKNGEFATTNDKGQDELHLRVPFRGGDAPVTVTRELDKEGKRTAYLEFGDGWKNYWKYEDGPDQAGQLTPCTKDPETGEFVPRQKKRDSTYDPTSDYEVAFWGKPWVNNLNNGRPELPKSPSRIKKLGKSVLGRLGRAPRSKAGTVRPAETELQLQPAAADSTEQPTPHSPEWAKDGKLQHERRTKLENGLGEVLTLAFDGYEKYVSEPNSEGIDQLTLRVSYRGRSEALFSCARKTHPDEADKKNHRTVLMALRHKQDGEKYWRFDDWEDGDGKRISHLIPMQPSPEHGRGALVPKRSPEPGPGNPYDPNSDYEVANDIEHYLLNNFKGEPVKPNKADRKKR